MAFLTRETIRAKAASIAVVKVPIGDNGDEINVRHMTPAFLDGLLADKSSTIQQGVLTVLECIVGEDGKPLFETKEEVAALPGPLFRQLSDAVAKVNELKTPEEIAKN